MYSRFVSKGTLFLHSSVENEKSSLRRTVLEPSTGRNCECCSWTNCLMLRHVSLFRSQYQSSASLLTILVFSPRTRTFARTRQEGKQEKMNTCWGRQAILQRGIERLLFLSVTTIDWTVRTRKGWDATPLSREGEKARCLEFLSRSEFLLRCPVHPLRCDDSSPSSYSCLSANSSHKEF